MSELPITSIKFKKVGDKLVINGKHNVTLYNKFIATLSEGVEVDVTFDARLGDKTYSQLARMHKGLRALALSTGFNFIDLKYAVKRESGLYTEITDNGSNYIEYKSFEKCSFDELTIALESLYALGDMAGVNLR